VAAIWRMRSPIFTRRLKVLGAMAVTAVLAL
jgi:hypothetical protein